MLLVKRNLHTSSSRLALKFTSIMSKQSLLVGDGENGTINLDEIHSLKLKTKSAESHQDLSGKASDLISGIVCSQNKKIVMIGESSHGTAEFYETRSDITRRLIEEKKCFAVLLEADMPPCASLHRYVMGDDITINHAMRPFADRFPSWMWANEEFQHFVQWLRDFNRCQLQKERVSIVGMDLYSLQTSMNAVISYLRESGDVECASRVAKSYDCFGNMDSDVYGMLVEMGIHHSCADAASKACLAIIEDEAALVPPGSDLRTVDECFITEMNARVVQGAEQYYRSMFAPHSNSWNVRDRHFMDQLDRTMEHLVDSRGQNFDQVVVWAHNSHVGNAHYTHLERHQPMQSDQSRYHTGGGGGEEEHEFNIGELAKRAHPDDTLLVGQFTHSGTVACADFWEGPQRVKPIRPGLTDSLEDVLHAVSGPGGNLIINLKDTATRKLSIVRAHRLQRAIGVVYRPDTERWSHYNTCDVANQFDVVIWHDITTAVCPLVLK